MAQYITRRVLLAVLVVIGVTLLTFISIHLSGDPAVLYVSERAGQEELAEARRRLGLDKPLPEQYLNFLSGLARGDLGLSLANRTPALALVIERLPATLELTLGALLLSNIIAIPIGLISAVKRGTRLDGTIMLVAMFGQSMPGFWLGIMSILFFGVTLRAFPVSGQVPVLAPLLAGDINTALQNLPAGIHHAILPVVTISVFSIARNAVGAFGAFGSAGAGICDHRPRERLIRTAGYSAPRLAECHDPDCDHRRVGIRLSIKRRDCNRVGVRMAGCRALGI